MLSAPKQCKVRHCSEFIRGNVCAKKCKRTDAQKKVTSRHVTKKLYDDRRGSSTKRGYGYAWQKAREGYLRNHPLCVFCDRVGFVNAADVVDHIKPYSSYSQVLGKKVYDKKLQWDKYNWQPLCKHHHDVDKQAIEFNWRKGLLPDDVLSGVGWDISKPKL